MAVLEKLIENMIVCNSFYFALNATSYYHEAHSGSYLLVLMLAILLSISGSNNSIVRTERQKYYRLHFRKLGDDAFVYIVTTMSSVFSLILNYNSKNQYVLWSVCYYSTLGLTLFGMYLQYSKKIVLCTVLIFMTFKSIFLIWKFLLLGILAVVIFFIVVRICPQTFTFCEASMLSQTILFLLVNQVLNLHLWYFDDLPHNINSTTTYFICALFSSALIIIALLSPILHYSTCFESNLQGRWIFAIIFYSAAALCLCFVFLPLAYISIGKNPVLWLLEMLFLNNVRISLMLYWTILVFISILVVHWYTSTEIKIPKTIVRKIFHVIAVFIYVPAIYEYNFIALVSALVFVIFIVLEIIRVSKIKPFGDFLDIYLRPFRDQQDGGILLLTHIYLLFGLSFPFWIHDVIKSKTNNPFHLLSIYSGVISLGIGDTFAAIFGKLYGQTKWPGGQKTYLGTLCCFLTQLIFICFLIDFGTNETVNPEILIVVIPICFYVALLESVSTQIDNIILPIYTFIYLNIAAIVWDL